MKRTNKLGLLAAGFTLVGVGGLTALQTVPALAHDNELTLETNAPVTVTDDDYALPNVRAITKQVMPSIVAITAESKETIEYWGRRYEQDSEKAGSGVIIAQTEDELIIATNNHVVDNAHDLTVLFSVDVEKEKDALVPAQVKGTDSSLDLAVVSVKISDIPKEVLDQIAVVEIGDSSAMNVGDWSVAIGNALGYGQSVTFGIISALDREVTLNTDHGEISNHMLQTDAAINFGNSGGALLNADGQLIGINSAKASSSGVEGMGYAIPINTAKPILEDLMNQTTREKADTDKAGALGVSVTNVSDEARSLYSIPAGAYVLEVTEGSAAEDAGIVKGDIIVKLERTTISSMNELLARMEYYEAGEEVEVTVKHPSENGYVEKVVTVKLQEKANTDTSKDEKDNDKDDEKTESYPDEEFDDYEESDGFPEEFMEEFENYHMQDPAKFFGFWN